MNKKILFLGLLTAFLIYDHSKCFGEENKTNNYYRGVVIYPSDITTVGVLDFIKYMQGADINLLGIHSNILGRNPITGASEDLANLKLFLESKEGKLLINECKKLNIDIEFESHVLKEILPRELFEEHPEYFRMDEKGVRRKDHNMCFSSEEAYQEIEKNILEVVKWLKPTTHRYFFWTDDVKGAFCNCDLCKKYSDSEQALLYENKLLTILRKIDPLATLAHLAYHNTLKAPEKVRPMDGIFLEYAPINRDYSYPLSEEQLQDLKENLKIFPANTAHVLEYWLDVSMFSGWKRESLIKVPWSIEYCERDIELYHGLGIRSITSFGTWMLSGDYLKKYGENHVLQVINEYGLVLKKYLK